MEEQRGARQHSSPAARVGGSQGPAVAEDKQWLVGGEGRVKITMTSGSGGSWGRIDDIKDDVCRKNGSRGENFAKPIGIFCYNGRYKG